MWVLGPSTLECDPRARLNLMLKFGLRFDFEFPNLDLELKLWNDIMKYGLRSKLLLALLDSNTTCSASYT